MIASFYVRRFMRDYMFSVFFIDACGQINTNSEYAKDKRLRNVIAKHNIFFNADGWTFKGIPFLHEKVLRYYTKGDGVYIFLAR